MQKNLYLPYEKPFSWEGHLNFYRVFSIPDLESISNNCFERVFEQKSVPNISTRRVAYMNVSNDQKNSKLKVKIIGDNVDIGYVRKRLRWMFDLDIDSSAISKAFRKNRLLHGLLNKYPGLRLSRSWDDVEALICTILSQLISAKQARALISELVNHYGKTEIHPATGNKIKLFPTLEVLSRSNLSKVRTTEKRKQTIREVSKMLKAGESVKDLSWFAEVSGVGPWTVNYAKIRVGERDAFPASDLAIGRMIKKFKSLKNIDSTSPFRSYAAIYLWKHYANIF